MSEENLELAREALDAIGRQDTEALLALAHPEVEWHSLFAMGSEGGYRGHAGTREYMSDLADAWEIGRAEVESAMCAGNVAVLIGHIRYRGKESGVESRTPVGWMIRCSGGQVIEFRAFRDPETALARIGLP